MEKATFRFGQGSVFEQKSCNVRIADEKGGDKQVCILLNDSPLQTRRRNMKPHLHWTSLHTSTNPSGGHHQKKYYLSACLMPRIITAGAKWTQNLSRGKFTLIPYSLILRNIMETTLHCKKNLACITVHQSLVESLLEKGWSNNRSFLGVSACQLQAVEQGFFCSIKCCGKKTCAAIKLLVFLRWFQVVFGFFCRKLNHTMMYIPIHIYENFHPLLPTHLCLCFWPGDFLGVSACQLQAVEQFFFFCSELMVIYHSLIFSRTILLDFNESAIEWFDYANRSQHTEERTYQKRQRKETTEEKKYDQQLSWREVLDLISPVRKRNGDEKNLRMSKRKVLVQVVMCQERNNTGMSHRLSQRTENGSIAWRNLTEDLDATLVRASAIIFPITYILDIFGLRHNYCGAKLMCISIDISYTTQGYLCSYHHVKATKSKFIVELKTGCSTCVASVLQYEQNFGYSGFQNINRVQTFGYPNIQGQQVSHSLWMPLILLHTHKKKPVFQQQLQRAFNQDRIAQHLLNHNSTMSNLLCLGKFIIPLYYPTPISFPEFCQAFLQRCTSQVHIWCYPRCLVGALSQLKGELIGPLLGQIGNCSSPISEEGLTNNPSIMKL
ncbi:hypothetical protein VP01_2125g2 [Puccinia sorghi]|uniref:Uncharacterized protein n=1 Tax=Puccinia sorghi TaxID=27349 RepID=A0A0L6V9X8_9BASI|nr:hypothetical protein VP01_2125g2 [Puccinia sorghi]